jgi:hypothetical protein
VHAIFFSSAAAHNSRQHHGSWCTQCLNSFMPDACSAEQC